MGSRLGEECMSFRPLKCISSKPLVVIADQEKGGGWRRILGSRLYSYGLEGILPFELRSMHRYR